MSSWACCLPEFPHKGLYSSFIGTLLKFCGVTRDLVFGVLAGFSFDFGEFAFIFRISVAIFVRFLIYSVSIFLPKNWTITDCTALLVTHHFFAVGVEMMRNFVSRVAPKRQKQ